MAETDHRRGARRRGRSFGEFREAGRKPFAGAFIQPIHGFIQNFSQNMANRSDRY
jgi:hypothetical protein